MQTDTLNEIHARASEMQRLLFHMGRALNAMAGSTPPAIEHHLVVFAAACEAGSDKAAQIMEAKHAL
jgi:hypothetical protein